MRGNECEEVSRGGEERVSEREGGVEEDIGGGGEWGFTWGIGGTVGGLAHK